MNKLNVKKTALAVGLGALFAGTSAQASMSYNLQAETGGGLCGNGGGACPANGTAAGPWTNGNPGYDSLLPATWISVIENAGGVAASETASSADAGFRIDMGATAYKDGVVNWGHTTDFGLFRLQESAWVTIDVSSDNSALRPAFGLWEGWATGGSGRHTDWLNNGALNPMGEVFYSGLTLPNGQTIITNPSGLQVIDPDAWAVAAATGGVGNNVTATLTRYLEAGDYTILLGGYETPPFLAGQGEGPAFKAYTATISAAAPVPLPASVWLFGSAVAGFGAIGRRKARANG